MGFNGFDIPKIRTLAGDMGKLGNGASKLHTDVALVLTQASSLMGGKPATTSPRLEPLIGQIIAWPFGGGRGLPGSLSHELDDMSGSMKRRCDQLEAAGKLLDKGYKIDPALAFADEKAPDEKKITDALSALAALDGKDFGSNGNREDLQKIAQQLEGLTPAELDAFFDKVPEADLRRYNDLISNDNDGSWLKWWDHNGLPDNERQDHLSRLLEKVGPAHWNKMKNAFPGIQPGFDTTDAYLDGATPQTGLGAKGMHWGSPTDPMFADGVSADDISQGRFGDCWYIASLTATTQVDPQFIRDGIKQNPNGTVSVRVWDKDGDLHWVTVTPDIPMDENGNPMSAYGDGESWPAYYEKAFALMYSEDDGGTPDGKEDDPKYDHEERGTYGAVEWDYNEKAPPYLTGQEAESIDDDFDSVKNAFESRHPVIVSTGSEAKDVPQSWGQSFSTRHVYYVKGFHDGKIVLGNPWGSNYPPIEATPEEFEKFFGDPQALQGTG